MGSITNRFLPISPSEPIALRGRLTLQGLWFSSLTTKNWWVLFLGSELWKVPAFPFTTGCQMRLGNLCFYFTCCCTFISFAQGCQKVPGAHLDFLKHVGVDLRATPWSKSSGSTQQEEHISEKSFRELSWWRLCGSQILFQDPINNILL